MERRGHYGGLKPREAMIIGSYDSVRITPSLITRKGGDDESVDAAGELWDASLKVRLSWARLGNVDNFLSFHRHFPALLVRGKGDHGRYEAPILS